MNSIFYNKALEIAVNSYYNYGDACEAYVVRSALIEYLSFVEPDFSKKEFERDIYAMLDAREKALDEKENLNNKYCPYCGEDNCNSCSKDLSVPVKRSHRYSEKIY